MRQPCRPRLTRRSAGKAYAEYWVGRLNSGSGISTAMEAIRRAAAMRDEADRLRKAGRPEDAKQKMAEAGAELKRALELSRAMLESYRSVAQDQSDRGAVATMAEYVYRPLKGKCSSGRRNEDDMSIVNTTASRISRT